MGLANTSGRRAAVLVIALGAACATAPRSDGGGGHYPRRPANCKLTVFHTPTPTGVAAWDDLGAAEVACYIDTARPECLQRLKAEACRMGGDIIYNLPEKPLRPRDQVIVYRAQVAHTRAGTKPEEPAPAAEPRDAGPIEPLAPVRPAAAADGGAG